MAGRHVADEMNREIYKYLRHVGVSEAGRREFERKAIAMKGLMGAFSSQRFCHIIMELHQFVKAIRECRVGNLPNLRDFDLNEEPPHDELHSDGDSNSTISMV